MSNQEILTKALQWEGGFADNLADKGGATKWGITVSTLSHWRKRQVTIDEVKALTQAEALKIYEQLYIINPCFDPLPSPLKEALIDYAINSGPAVAVRHLQDCLGVTADGVIGTETMGAIKRADPVFLTNCLCKARVLMIGKIVRRDPSQAQFLEGWLRRVLAHFV